jgi:AcrR family transcriptional regulator
MAHYVRMNASPKPKRGEPSLLWERSEPAIRPVPTPLSREKIVQAAISIADNEGLVAVSLRNVGASLKAGPMRLYGYLSTKEELLDLMIDAVYGEIVAAGPIEGDWRDIFRTIAHRIREACRRHPWFADLLGGRPHLGPNALTMLEASLAALHRVPGFDRIDVCLQAMSTVNAYVIGAVRSEANDLKSGMNKAEWQQVWWPYLERTFATGQFPMLEKIVHDTTHPTPETDFERGLQTVLDGLAVRL